MGLLTKIYAILAVSAFALLWAAFAWANAHAAGNFRDRMVDNIDLISIQELKDRAVRGDLPPGPVRVRGTVRLIASVTEKGAVETLRSPLSGREAAAVCITAWLPV